MWPSKHIPENTVVIDALSREMFLLFFFLILHPPSLSSPSVPISPLPFFIYNFISVALTLFSCWAGAAPLRASAAARTVRGAWAVGGCHGATPSHSAGGPVSSASEPYGAAGRSWRGREKQSQAYFQKTTCSHLPANCFHRHEYPAYCDLLLEEEKLFLLSF